LAENRGFIERAFGGRGSLLACSRASSPLGGRGDGRPIRWAAALTAAAAALTAAVAPPATAATVAVVLAVAAAAAA